MTLKKSGSCVIKKRRSNYTIEYTIKIYKMRRPNYTIFNSLKSEEQFDTNYKGNLSS